MEASPTSVLPIAAPPFAFGAAPFAFAFGAPFALGLAAPFVFVRYYLPKGAFCRNVNNEKAPLVAL